jgi:hypothetical protein
MRFECWWIRIGQGILRDANGHPMFFATRTKAREVAAKWEGVVEKVSVKVSEL